SAGAIFMPESVRRNGVLQLRTTIRLAADGHAAGRPLRCGAGVPASPPVGARAPSLAAEDLAHPHHPAPTLDQDAGQPVQHLVRNAVWVTTVGTQLGFRDAEGEGELALGAEEEVRRALEVQSGHVLSYREILRCSTMRQRSWTTAIPARASVSAASSLRIPDWNHTARGFFSRRSGRCGGMSPGRRNTSTTSIGPGMSDTLRKTRSPRISSTSGSYTGTGTTSSPAPLRYAGT